MMYHTLFQLFTINFTGNVAYNKNADQSGSWDDNHASGAVDGNRNRKMDAGSCAHPDSTNGPAWWRVDLGSPHVIYNVTIINRDSNKGMWCIITGALNGTP